MADNLISVGKLGKPHGISGAFRFLLTRDLKSKKKLPNHFLVENKGNTVPFFIQSIEWVGMCDGFLKFEDVSSPEQAKLYSGKELFLRQSDVALLFKKDAVGLSFLVGFLVIDSVQGAIGAIEEIVDNPGQTLLIVRNESKEYIIPYVEEFILEENTKKKELLVQLPDGLLEI
jgi:16S rRNA processing protein RimM